MLFRSVDMHALKVILSIEDSVVAFHGVPWWSILAWSGDLAFCGVPACRAGLPCVLAFQASLQSGSQDQRKNPFEFRQCPLTLLRYLGGLLALTGYPFADLSQWLRDGLFVIRRFGAQKSRILAAQYIRDQDWFQDTWIPRAVAALPAYPSITGGRGHDGFLFSLLPFFLVSLSYKSDNITYFPLPIVTLV